MDTKNYNDDQPNKNIMEWTLWEQPTIFFFFFFFMIMFFF